MATGPNVTTGLRGGASRLTPLGGGTLGSNGTGVSESFELRRGGDALPRFFDGGGGPWGRRGVGFGPIRVQWGLRVPLRLLMLGEFPIAAALTVACNFGGV